MRTLATDDIHLKAEVYTELINDMQAKIYEYSINNPENINKKLKEINRQLSYARMKSRIYVDDEHFKEWEALLLAADATMIQNKLFR